MPNYFCNNDCEYCYLGNIKNDSKILNVKKLKHQLMEIEEKYIIDEINIFGGEVSLLPIELIQILYTVCQSYTNNSSIITNYSNSKFNKFLENNNIKYFTTINDERNNNDKIEKMIIDNDHKNLSLIQVVTPSLLRKSPKDILNHINKFNITDVGFLQYSPALHAQVVYNISNKEYSEFLRNIIIEYKNGNYNFDISNILDLDLVNNGKYDPTMKAVLFINPYNEYCSVDYDNGLEYFKSYGDNLDNWINEYKISYHKYPKECMICDYYGKCYAEHIREWDKDDECVGFKSLMEWYKENQ
jgi:sulfatase maturation enzyme AslB (radical SAM superfamily)